MIAADAVDEFFADVRAPLTTRSLRTEANAQTPTRNGCTRIRARRRIHPSARARRRRKQTNKQVIVSPFMSFAPTFLEWAEKAFPAVRARARAWARARGSVCGGLVASESDRPCWTQVAHLDGSARVQVRESVLPVLRQLPPARPPSARLQGRPSNPSRPTRPLPLCRRSQPKATRGCMRCCAPSPPPRAFPS